MYFSEANAIMNNITANENNHKTGIVLKQNSIMAKYILWFIEREHIANTYSIDERIKDMADKNLFNTFLNDEPAVMANYMSIIYAKKRPKCRIMKWERLSSTT